MPNLTESERLFARHCADRQIQCERIEEGTAKSADYTLTLGQTEMVVEVKQLDPNERDRIVKKNMEAGECQGGVAPSRRVRDQIAKAYKQLKPYAAEDRPCLVVLYNNAGYLNRIDKFTITAAMFGTSGIGLGLGSDKIIRPVSQGFGAKRKLTRNTCRGISAVCVISSSDSGTVLTVYHNPFALRPIDPADLSSLAGKQFRHEDPHSHEITALMPKEVVV